MELDRHGWAHLPTLFQRARREGTPLTREVIKKVMAESSKQRFRISEDGMYIRAGYGHSVDVELNLDPTTPPALLYHGTARRNLEGIRDEGVHSGSRNLVHLSAQKADARTVGQRHGKPVILVVRAEEMYREGHPFYQSESEPGIWLVEYVPPEFLDNWEQ